MTEAELKLLTIDEKNYIQSIAPRDTGNLADKALRTRSLGKLKQQIYISAAVAPYQKYLEYGTVKSTKHKGWFAAAARAVVKDVALRTRGQIDTTTIIKGGF